MPYFTSDGTNIHVEMSGDGSPLLFLHALTLDHRQWTSQKEALRGSFQVFRMDFRGHGRSARTVTGHSWAGWAADVQRGLVQLGMDRLQPGVVVAHGHACEVALHVALAEPRRIRALFLVAPVVSGAPLSPQWRELVHSVRQLAEAGELEEALAMWRQDASYVGVRAQATLERAIKEMQQGFSGDSFQVLDENGGESLFERLGECNTPVCVLSPAQDRRDFRDLAASLGERLPHARVHEWEGVAHFPNLESPDGFNRILRDWLEESAPGS
jgi:pimeloyl-ACP methyl ester carboxylesterase